MGGGDVRERFVSWDLDSVCLWTGLCWVTLSPDHPPRGSSWCTPGSFPPCGAWWLRAFSWMPAPLGSCALCPMGDCTRPCCGRCRCSACASVQAPKLSSSLAHRAPTLHPRLPVLGLVLKHLQVLMHCLVHLKKNSVQQVPPRRNGKPLSSHVSWPTEVWVLWFCFGLFLTEATYAIAAVFFVLSPL